jgi:hypothetical protein
VEQFYTKPHYHLNLKLPQCQTKKFISKTNNFRTIHNFLKQESWQKMDSNRKTAIIVGVLFIIVMVSTILSGVFSGSIDDPDYLTAVSANENQVLIGVLFMLTLVASVVAIPIMMFPIFKKHSESLALGYVGARIFEGIADVVIYGISPLLLLTLSREFVNAVSPDATYFQTTGALLLALPEWSSVLENFPYALGGLIFNYLGYKSKLVPRWLSGWGLIGATLMLATGLLRMFDPSLIYLAIPILMQEMVLAVWLIAKGFNLSIIAQSAKPDIESGIKF